MYLDTDGLLLALILSTSFFSVSLIVFEILRNTVPEIYLLKHYISEERGFIDIMYDKLYCPAIPRRYPLAWIFRVLELKEKYLVRELNLDSVLFLKSIKIMFQMFLAIAGFTMLILAPVYASGTNKDLPPSNIYYVSGVSVISIQNFPIGDNTLWVAFLFDVIIAALICLYVYQSILEYTIYRSGYTSSNNPSNFAILVRDLPRDCDKDFLKQFFNSFLNDQVERVDTIYDTSEVQSKTKDYVKAVGKWEWARVKLFKYQSKATKIDPEELSKLSIAVEEARQDVCGTLNELKHIKNIPVTKNAFVLFKEKKASSFAAQTSIGFGKTSFRITRAPEPRAVNWSKLPVSQFSSPFRNMVVIIFLLALLVVWAYIISAIQGLSNIEHLVYDEGLTIFEPILSWPSWIITFIQTTLPPLLLMIINSVVPIIMRSFVALQRLYSFSLIDVRTRTYSFVFYVFTNFVFVTISGSLSDQIRYILNGNDWVLLLATVADKAVFMMTYILQQAGIAFPLLLIQMPRIFCRPFIILFVGNETPRQKRTVNLFMHMFPFYKFYAIATSHAVIAIVYSTIAPLITVFATVYYVVAYIIMKYLLVYAYFHPYSGGGMHFRGWYQQLLLGLYIKCVIMTAYYVSQDVSAIAACELVLLAFIAVFNVVFYKKYNRLVKNGSLLQILTDNTEDTLPDEYRQLYVSPGLGKFMLEADMSGLPRAQIINGRGEVLELNDRVAGEGSSGED